MPMAADEIVTLIKQGIPDAEVEMQDMAGDGDHWAATVVSATFAGKSKIQQHQMVYAALGEKAQAMAWLERGYRERFNPGVLLRPGFDSLRADPGFRDLVNRVGLTR